MHHTLLALLVATGAGVDNTALVGTWTSGAALEARIAAPQNGKPLWLTLVLRGDVAQDGPLEGEGAVRRAAMNGCGATLTLKGQALEVALDGPECPVELAATYAKKSGPDLPRSGAVTSTMKGPAIDAWRALLSSGCDVKKKLFSPFEARVLRNAAFAEVGYTFKSPALTTFFKGEGHVATGTKELTDPRAKACTEALKAREDALQKVVPMSADLLDRLLADPVNFDTFRGWSDRDTSPFGKTIERKDGGAIHWESRDPGCKGDECSALTVDCATPTACVAIAAG